MSLLSIYDIIPRGHDNAISRKKLVEITGKGDRQVRELIMNERMKGRCILNAEDGKGYFRPILPAEMDFVRAAYDREAGRCYSASVNMETLSLLMEEYPE